MAMDMVHKGAKATEAAGRAHFIGLAFVIAAVIVAVVSAAILGTTLIARPTAGSALGIQEDPFLQPAAIEFRRSEHAEGASPEDPFLQPAAIEFRRSEHAEGATR